MTARLESQDLEHLVWTLNASEGFTLFFVSVPGAASTEAVLRQINREGSLLMAPVRLDSDRSITEQIAHGATRFADESRPLAIVGMDARLSRSNDALAFASTQELNWKRNALVRTGRAMVFFVSPEGLQRLANGAPDFFDYRSGVYSATLAPNPRFWLYDRVSVAPDEAKEARNRIEEGRRRLAVEQDASLTARLIRLDEITTMLRLCLVLLRFGEAEEFARQMRLTLAEIPNPSASCQIQVGILEGLLLEFGGRYEEAREEFTTLLYWSAADLPSDAVLHSEISYRLCKAAWYVGNDDGAVLDQLDRTANPRNDPRINQLRAMVYETIPRLGAEQMLRAQIHDLRRDHPMLVVSAKYHVARSRLTIGDLVTTRYEIEELISEASRFLGPDHDAVGFIRLLDARTRIASREKGVVAIARRGLASIIRVHGIQSDSTLDAVVQIREMGLNPLQIARGVMSDTDFVQAETLWVTKSA